MSVQTVDQKSEVKQGDCYANWDSKYKECTEECKVRARCKKDTMAAGKPAPKVQPKEEDENVFTDESMDPMECLITGLKGKFDDEHTSADNFTRWRFRKDGKAVLQILISKTTKQVRIQSATVTILLQEGLKNIAQARGIFQFV